VVNEELWFSALQPFPGVFSSSLTQPIYDIIFRTQSGIVEIFKYPIRIAKALECV
jgi:hypothetical protein